MLDSSIKELSEGRAKYRIIFKDDVTDCFNLINQFNFYRAENFLLYIGIRIVILISLVLIFKLVYKDKESFVKFVEKESEISHGN